MVFVFLWLNSLSVIISSGIHVAADGIILFFFNGWIVLPCGFPGGSVVKNPPAVQEMLVRSLGREDPLEEAVATHSSILAWEIPWREAPGGLQSIGL